MQSFLECGICLEQFNESKRKPVVLPCGHTICIPCISLMAKDNSVECPFDHKKHEVKIEDLPINFQVLGFLDAKPSSDTESTKSAETVKAVKIEEEQQEEKPEKVIKKEEEEEKQQEPDESNKDVPEDLLNLQQPEKPKANPDGEFWPEQENQAPQQAQPAQ